MQILLYTALPLLDPFWDIWLIGKGGEGGGGYACFKSEFNNTSLSPSEKKAIKAEL